jgi:hypothetical protein
MWVQRSSIRPVPSYAKVGRAALEHLRSELLTQADQSPPAFDAMFQDFEDKQPILADHVGGVLSNPLSDAAVALGYFLSVAIWIAFDRTLGTALDPISSEELRSTVELFAFDHDLRQHSPGQSVDTGDVVFMEQPALVEFVRESIQATVRANQGQLGEDEVRQVHHMLLIEILALSYAVRAPAGFPLTKSEILA